MVVNGYGKANLDVLLNAKQALAERGNTVTLHQNVWRTRILRRIEEGTCAGALLETFRRCLGQ